jgi:hypothetical protein
MFGDCPPNLVVSIVFTIASLGCCSGQADSENQRTNQVETSRRVANSPFVAETVELPPIVVAERETIFSHEFIVTNSLNRAMRFIDIRKSCSCIGETAIEKMELAPNESTRLRLRGYVRDQAGPRRLICSLLCDDQREFVYELKANSYFQAQFLEGPTKHLSNVQPGSPVKVICHLVLHARQAHELGTIESVATFCQTVTKIGNSETSQLPDGIWRRVIPIELELPPAPTEPGLYHHQVVCEVSNLPRTARPTLDLSYSVPDTVIFAPRVVWFSLDDREIRIVIRRFDSQPLKVIEADIANSDWVEAEVVPTKGPTAVVLCRINRARLTSTRQPLYSELRIRTDQSNERELRVPIAAAQSEP